MHGNLYAPLLPNTLPVVTGFPSLDGLPFPPDHFDFVRIARIGLGVPEDEVRSLSCTFFAVLMHVVSSGNMSWRLAMFVICCPI